ncbi:hypothetical protein PGQ11_005769 [Apiospora arundinis]|uniref:Uncharacterized protein n=1 Tax=Apiospora arundinis TaxID=335852 RepID=A0ABR2JBR1_9PEZI
MLSPLVLIPAFLGTAIYAVVATGPIPSTFRTSTTTYSSSSLPCPTAPSTTSSGEPSSSTTVATAAPPLTERALPEFEPFSIAPIPSIPGFSEMPPFPSSPAAPTRPDCARYVCFVECRIGVVTSNCKDCCAEKKKTKEAATDSAV